MDTVSHGIAGSVLARAASRRPEARAALVFGAVAALFPDLDFLFFSSRMQYLRDHRSWSHSFIYLPLFALGLALVARLIFRKAPLWTLWICCAVGIASHILFDWITSFGTQFFYPLSRARYSLDWVFILDPFFTGILLATLAGTLVLRARARLIAAAGSALLFVYLGLCAAMHERALAVWKALDHPPAGSTVAALPQFLSPFRWLGLSERPGEAHAAFFDIGPFARGAADPKPPARLSELLQSLSDFYPPPARARVLVFPQAPETPLLLASRELPDVRIYLAFARFPLATLLPQADGGAAVTWEDLRFLPWFAGPWESDHRGGFRREPFVYRVRLDAAGRPLERAFVIGTR
ncbi:MAG TPA: metal-dependent hydrolase [Thermoanaerobaculia bacterium]|nr:metal-dependent hydrolase [Thermoanaerobaculia bacterium]